MLKINFLLTISIDYHEQSLWELTKWSQRENIWSFTKFSQLIFQGNVWRSVWRICMWILGLKGLTWFANRQWHFWQANHDVYSNSGTQLAMAAQNKDFGTSSPTDFSRSLVLLVAQATQQCLNPLGPKSDQHQFSPNNISRSSRVKVMRITKLITKGRMLWS